MLYSYLILQVALFLLSLGGYFQVKKFLHSHNAISDPRALDNFKSLVRTNMYIALVYIALGIPGIVMSIYIGYVYGVMGIAAVLALNVPQFLFGKHLRALEERARKLRCSTDLSAEFRLVGETWFKKALPNF